MPPALFYLFVAFATLTRISVRAAFPPKIFGVNLGAWLLIEPWMLPQEWKDMGGESCSDCSTCIASEFAFAQAFPNTVDQIFNKHWETWFNQADVDNLVGMGINTVRVPLGYWIVEDLVDRSTEFYARGGLRQLRRGLNQLKNAGITVLLSHHALPGVQSAGQMFTGRCTNDVQFYTPRNYHRALIWTAVMTTLSHLDSNFGSVTAIEAVNEPTMDASLTPGYGEFQKHYVEVVRAVEMALGIRTTGYEDAVRGLPAASNLAIAFSSVSSQSIFDDEVSSVLMESIPIILKIAANLGIKSILRFSRRRSLSIDREPLITTFMDIKWQFNNPSNPADAANGPQVYDDHLYYSFGGVADPNEDAYLKSVCNLQRIQDDAKSGNSPVVFGEWSLGTQFPASDEFMRKWADAQKLAYGKSAGWMFWSFKIEKSSLTGDLARQWSYMEGVRLGYLTRDPSQFHDPHVCDSFIV